LIAYLTLGDKYSGIFSGQVVDVCNLLSEKTGARVKLISFVSIRGYWKEKRKIKHVYHNSIVLPLFPKLRNWRYNIILLLFVSIYKRFDTIICRNSIPSYLGLILKKKAIVKKIILDGRGAEFEQYIEYDMLSDKILENNLKQIESYVVNNVDYRIAVSEKLVDYWRNTFGYSKSDHIVIPCTLNRSHENLGKSKFNRKDYGFKDNDIVLVYCGSVSGWQSFDKMFKFIRFQMNQNKDVKLLLLTKEVDEVKTLMKEYPNRIVCKWSSNHDVIQLINLGDYGLIVRESTITNKVASPVKFAEYLFAGLRIIMSEKIGDCNLFLKENNCGIVDTEVDSSLHQISTQEKNKNRKISLENFSKNHNIIDSKYEQLINRII
jgi:hypothetical protein